MPYAISSLLLIPGNFSFIDNSIHKPAGFGGMIIKSSTVTARAYLMGANLIDVGCL
jgi:hypothetical protein